MLRFYEKSNYGRVLIYPADRFAWEIEKLTGKKTITEEQLKCLGTMGIEFTVDRLPSSNQGD